jgi:iron(III) transport system ATP-binding protein
MFSIENLQKSFVASGMEVRAVDGVSLDVESGKLVTLLGPSGCGKTTTLRCLAGLERPNGGRIVIGNRVVFDDARRNFVPASDRGIGMVFQSYAIWPHMTVFENVAFPLRVCRTRKYLASEIKDRVSRMLNMVQLADLARRPATQLSGGQQQRLAFARGLVHEPSILLLDEPLSNLDAKLRAEMRLELKRLQRSLGITAVYVTHDQAEALALSDEIAVFNAGKILQQGSPQEIYRRPNSRFVADFIGSANFLPGVLLATSNTDDIALVKTRHGTFRCRCEHSIAPGESVVLSARPEDLSIHVAEPGEAFNVLPGTIANQVFLGDVVDYVVATGDGELRVRETPDCDYRIGQPVQVAIAPHRCLALAK